MTATSAVDSPDDEKGTATAESLGFPFAWEHGPQAPRSGSDRPFRLPAADDRGPGPRRLLAMVSYAALVGLLALAVTLRGVFAIMSGTAPAWYEPLFVVSGVVGFGCVLGGFLSVHRRRLPWLLLGIAAVPLAVNVVATIQAT